MTTKADAVKALEADGFNHAENMVDDLVNDLVKHEGYSEYDAIQLAYDMAVNGDY